MNGHIVTSFDQDLNRIETIIRDMGELGAEMVAGATCALLNSDEPLAQRIVAEDVIMDARQRELDDAVIALIAKRQPMAQDLRAVIGALRIASDLERIGDLAKNIAKRVPRAKGSSVPSVLSGSLQTMSNLVLGQVRGVVAPYAEHDAQGLADLRDSDEKVDVQYTAVFRELLTYMMEDPRNISACTHLLFCVKNLERIGDHITNIAENAYYTLTGQQLPASRPKADETTMM